MKTFKYFDYKNGGQLIFETTAKSIAEADKSINEALGIKVEKCSWIGCQINK
jgi:ribosome biogenesis protein Tsr3